MSRAVRRQGDGSRGDSAGDLCWAIFGDDGKRLRWRRHGTCYSLFSGNPHHSAVGVGSSG